MKKITSLAATVALILMSLSVFATNHTVCPTPTPPTIPSSDPTTSTYSAANSNSGAIAVAGPGNGYATTSTSGYQTAGASVSASGAHSTVPVIGTTAFDSVSGTTLASGGTTSTTVTTGNAGAASYSQGDSVASVNAYAKDATSVLGQPVNTLATGTAVSSNHNGSGTNGNGSATQLSGNTSNFSANAVATDTAGMLHTAYTDAAATSISTAIGWKTGSGVNDPLANVGGATSGSTAVSNTVHSVSVPSTIIAH